MCTHRVVISAALSRSSDALRVLPAMTGPLGSCCSRSERRTRTHARPGATQRVLVHTASRGPACSCSLLALLAMPVSMAPFPCALSFPSVAGVETDEFILEFRLMLLTAHLVEGELQQYLQRTP